MQIAISQAKRHLPKDIPNDPTFKQVDPNSRPIMYIVMSSDTLSHEEIYNLAINRLVNPISTLNGVSTVTIRSVPSAIRINLNPLKMASFGISLSDIKNALAQENVNLSGGSLSSEYKTFSIVPNGQLTTPVQYNSIIIKYENNNPVFIRDIGKAYESTENDYFNLKFFNNNNKQELVNPVMLEVSRQNGSNTIQVADSVTKMISNLKKNLPSTVNLSIVRNDANQILEGLNDVKITLLIAFVLVVLVILFFMNRWRETVIPAVVIPVTLGITVLVMYLLNFSIDNLSLMAITLAIGFIVDDAIVVLENAERYIEMGYTPIKAAVDSAKEIFGAVVSMSMSLIIVFVPLVFMGGVVGLVFREFSLTVIIAIACSCIVSLSLTPMMNSKLLKHISKNNTNRIIFYKDKILDKTIEYYGILLSKFIKKSYLAVILWAVCIIVSLVFFALLPKTFIPNGDSGDIFGQIKFPLGISHVQSAKYQSYVDNILKNDPNISRFFSITGMSTDADQSTGIINIFLKPNGDRLPINDVINELRKKFSNIPFPEGNVYIQAKPVLKIPTGGGHMQKGSQYQYTITGNSLDDVEKYGTILLNKLKTMPQFISVQSDVTPNMPQLNININRNKAESLGITAQNIESALNLAFAQGEVTQYNEGINQFDVIVQNSNRYSQNPEDLSHIYVKSNTTGAMIPLNQIATSKEVVGPETVSHNQQLDSATISFNLKEDIPLSEATNLINNLSKNMFPTTVQGEFTGTAQQFLGVVSSLESLIFIAIFLMYILLGVLYENYIYPLTVLATLPTATVGGLGTLLFFNSSLSLYAYIGMFLLLGIVAKNGIIMIDFAVQKMANSKVSATDAVHEACIARFRPILMTGLTAIMGALPIAIGFGYNASMRQPLGLIIVGGLIVSQIITLFITPGIFIFLDNISKSLVTKLKKKKSLR